MIAAVCLGATAGEILDYRDSSAISGDEAQVVGYLSAAFYKPSAAASRSMKA
jgi:AmmeMemoRadiSam system protein B